jgi:ATP-dependent Zn protease
LYASLALCDPQAADVGENGVVGVPMEETERNSEGINALCKEAWENACKLIDEHAAAVERVADMLLEGICLDGNAVAAVIDEYKSR